MRAFERAPGCNHWKGQERIGIHKEFGKIAAFLAAKRRIVLRCVGVGIEGGRKRSGAKGQSPKAGGQL